MARSYKEKLLDPRWQKKRLEIFERDKWACRVCGDTTSTLCVHHMRYESGLEPWEYDNSRLITLCQPCHVDEAESRADYERDLLEILRNEAVSCGELFTISETYSRFIDKNRVPEIGDILYLLSYKDEFWNDVCALFEKYRNRKPGDGKR